jgi:hypothetical protein
MTMKNIFTFLLLLSLTDVNRIFANALGDKGSYWENQDQQRTYMRKTKNLIDWLEDAGSDVKPMRLWTTAKSQLTGDSKFHDANYRGLRFDSKTKAGDLVIKIHVSRLITEKVV